MLILQEVLTEAATALERAFRRRQASRAAARAPADTPVPHSADLGAARSAVGAVPAAGVSLDASATAAPPPAGGVLDPTVDRAFENIFLDRDLPSGEQRAEAAATESAITTDLLGFGAAAGGDPAAGALAADPRGGSVGQGPGVEEPGFWARFFGGGDGWASLFDWEEGPALALPPPGLKRRRSAPGAAADSAVEAAHSAAEATHFAATAAAHSAQAAEAAAEPAAPVAAAVAAAAPVAAATSVGTRAGNPSAVAPPAKRGYLRPPARAGRSPRAPRGRSPRPTASRFEVDAGGGGPTPGEEPEAPCLSPAGGKPLRPVGQAARLDDLFDVLDADGDGALSRAELATGQGAAGLGLGSAAEAGAVFDRFDADGSGGLDRAEAGAALAALHASFVAQGAAAEAELRAFLGAHGLARYAEALVGYGAERLADLADRSVVDAAVLSGVAGMDAAALARARACFPGPPL